MRSVLRHTEMHLQAWLKSYITRAFAGVTLGDGVDIHTARFHDSYGLENEEYRLAAGCQRGNWTYVDPQLLRDRAWVLPFLDTQGFRFYLPVMMIDIVEHEHMSDLPETLFYNFKIDRFGRFKDHAFGDVFNRHQEAAIVRFLKYLLFNRGWKRDSNAGKLLTRLQELRRRVAESNDGQESPTGRFSSGRRKR